MSVSSHFQAKGRDSVDTAKLIISGLFLAPLTSFQSIFLIFSFIFLDGVFYEVVNKFIF